MRTSFFIILVLINFNLCFSQNSFVGSVNIGGSSSLSNYVGTSYALTGVNFWLTTFNGIQYYNGKRPNSNAGFALVTGFTQLILPNLDMFNGVKEIKFNNLNHISGTATIIVGSLMLLNKKKKSADGISYLPYVSPFNDGLVVGIVLSGY